MSLLLNGDCLEEMKQIEDDSIDLVFCDLPYATKKYSQVSCKWNTPIDLDKFWIEIMRIKKLNTPIFMTCTTKFGVDLINSAPKMCPFRYDIVWCKSAPAGFLLAKKMPMRKHEMVYVFYEKLPFYDLSSHKHKFIKETKSNRDENSCYGSLGKETQSKYDPPLPVSVVKEPEPETESKYVGKPVMRENTTYGDVISYEIKERKNGESRYDPPLPVSIVKEDEQVIKEEKQSNKYIPPAIRHNPPLPTTMLEIKSTRGKHSTEKPVALMEWILKYYSKEGDVVLDPTMGSGSTGVACKNMNRNFIGIERDTDIYDSAIERIES